MKRYNSINGLRTIACIGIVLMHIKSNINYELSGNIANLIINSFTQFVFLFMIISSFAMCCGYYDKIRNNKITIEEFYKKRFIKILPFFLCLILLEVIIEHNIPSLIEGFADSTLMFGFLCKEINVLGVAWYLGLTCIFYMIFPFFVFLFNNKNRAWFVTIISVIMNLTATFYFEVGRSNMYFSFVFFCIGGLIYLYKDNIEKIVKSHKILFIVMTTIFTIGYYFIAINDFYCNVSLMIIFTLWLMLAIGIENNVVLDNKITKFISEISLEIYLSHMVIFRIIEKIKLTQIFQNNWLSYIITCVLVLVVVSMGAVVFNLIWKKYIKNKFERIK